VGPVLDAALRKLSAALPATTRDAAERARERLLVDPADWWEAPPPPPPSLREVEEAVWSERRLRFTYARSSSSEEAGSAVGASKRRLVDPYALVVKHGTWYLVAKQVRDVGEERPEGDTEDGRDARDRREEPAVFRVSRMRDVEVTEEGSIRPAGFDLEAFWAKACVDFRATRPQLPARVRAAQGAAYRLARVFGGGAPLPPPDADGRYTLSVDLQTLDIGCHELMGHGAQVEALEPPALRERVAAALREAAGVYG
jgi:predicted DNA-binding transcriptional regulator YafY